MQNENYNPINGVVEIAAGTTIEEIKAAYFNENALRQPTYRLCQINARGSRYYYNINEAGKAEFYPSVTTLIRKVAPENTFLTEWKLSLGKAAADAYTQERAFYGSFIHTQLQELLVTRHYPLDEIRERLKKYAETNNLLAAFVDAHEEEAKEDILSFAKWAIDYDVKPYAIEVALYHRELKYAGLTDCVANMRKYPVGDKRGDERVDAIVDFKTTRKEFHDEHAIQLELYRLAWNLEFPDLPIDHIANVAPKAWSGTARKAVSYRFEWQTGNPVLKRIPFLIGLYQLEADEESRKIALVSGEINLDNGIDSNISVQTLEEIVANRTEKPQANENSPQEPDSDCDDLFAVHGE